MRLSNRFLRRPVAPGLLAVCVLAKLAATMLATAGSGGGGGETLTLPDAPAVSVTANAIPKGSRKKLDDFIFENIKVIR